MILAGRPRERKGLLLNDMVDLVVIEWVVEAVPLDRRLRE